MEDIRDELEELEEEMEMGKTCKNEYKEYINRLCRRGRNILVQHMWRTARFKAFLTVEGETPITRRILNCNEGSAPETVVRTYCKQCGKIRTLIIIPGRREAEIRASCVHVREDAIDAGMKDRRLVYIGRHRVVPAGIAKMLGFRILG